jgi:hypothetical protein
VNDDAWDLYLRRVPGSRDRDADDRAGLVNQAVALGRRLVAQDRIRPGPE